MLRRHNRRLFMALSPFLLIAALTAADQPVPGILSYQGALTDNGISVTGVIYVKVALVDGAGMTTYWSNDGTSIGGAEPTAALSTAATRGVFSVQLGDTSVTNMTSAVLAGVFANQDVRLRIWVSTAASGPFARLSTDTRISAVGYALKAQAVSNGAVTTAAIADGAVTAAKADTGTTAGKLVVLDGQARLPAVDGSQLTNVIAASQANGSVTSSAIGNGAVGTAQLATGAVTTAKIADGAITVAKLNGGAIDGVLPNQSNAAGRALVSNGSTATWGTSLMQWVAVGGSFTKTDTTANTGYLITSGSPTINLPISANPGDIFRIVSVHQTPWTIGQTTGQLIRVPGSVSISSGTTWAICETPRNWTVIASSSDGQRLVAGVYSGVLYRSTDGGSSWSQQDVDGASHDWTSLAISANGQWVYAGTGLGNVYASTDGGLTWTAHDSSRSWNSLTCSSDGSKVAAIANGSIYTSSDFGVTWVLRDNVNSWKAIASSADGTKLAVGGNSGCATSINSGATWTIRDTNPVNSISSSFDGVNLIATRPSPDTSVPVWISTNSGVSWTMRSFFSSNYAFVSGDGTRWCAVRNYSGVSISTDAGVTWTTNNITGGVYLIQMAAASADGMNMAVTTLGWYLYTSHGNLSSTSIGTNGKLIGAANSAVELVYAGNNEWVVTSATAGVTGQ